MKRKIVVAFTLYLLGVLAYLLFSRGPLRVHVVTVFVQFLYVISISCIAWLAPIGFGLRVVTLLGTVATISAFSTWMDSLVIMALRPLHPAYFAIGFVAFLIEGLLLLGLTWSIDRAIETLKVRRSQTEERRSS